MSQPSTDISQALKEHGITPTQQRMEIARVLLCRDQHLSAEQVLTQINDQSQQRHNSVSKATVYNTLGLFAQKGLIREVIVDPSRVFYDSNVSPHHHIYHVDEGTLTDIPVHQVEIARIPKIPNNTTIEGVDVIIRVRNTKE